MAIEHRQLLFSFLSGLCIFLAGLTAQLITPAFLPLALIGGAISVMSLYTAVKLYRRNKSSSVSGRLEEPVDAV